MINDYVDNALTDVVVRGMVSDQPSRDEYFAAPSSLPTSFDWKSGDLHWHGPNFKLTKYNLLERQRDGNVILYQLGRAAAGYVCKQVVLWKTNTERRGARLDFQDNGDFVVHDLKGDVLWKQGPAERLSLQADGNLVLYGANGKSIWASNTAGKNTDLGCN